MHIIELEKASGESANKLWQARIKKALAWRQAHWNGDRTWERALRLTRGDHWSTDSDDIDLSSDLPRDRITVNVTGGMVQDYIPFLVKRNPQFTVRPKRAEDISSAKYQELLLNYLWVEKDMTYQLRRAVLDAIILGHGIVKTGWTLNLSDSVKPGVTINYDEAIRDETPWVKRVSPFRFLFDPDAPDNDLRSARWAAEIFFRPFQDVLEDKRYNKRVISDIKAGIESPTTYESFLATYAEQASTISTLTREEFKAQELLVIFEVWDKRFKKRRVLLDGIDEPLIEDDWPYEYLDGFPYEMVPFIDIPDEHYPMGLVQFIEDQQLELNRIRTKDFDQHRRTGMILSAAKDYVDSSEISKATSGNSLEVIMHHGQPSDSPIQAVNMPVDNYRSREIQTVIYDDMRRMTGSDALVQGGDLKSRTSATEVNQRANFFGLKLEDKIEKVDSFFMRTGKQVLQHVKANMKLPKIVPILGIERAREAAAQFARLTVIDIQGDFDIEVATVSAERIDRATERQQRLQIFQMIMQNIQFLGGQISLPALFTWLLEAFDIKDATRFFTPSNSPISTPQVGSGNQVSLVADAVNPVQSQIQRSAVSSNSAGAGQQGGSLSLGNNLQS